jgi:hypothetical protein
MRRRTGGVAAGLILAATLACTGSVASAAQPAIKTKPGSQWTFAEKGAACEVETFASGGTWTSDQYGDSGTYTGGGSSIQLIWTAGDDEGLTYSGHWVAAKKEFKGSGVDKKATLTKGTNPAC